MPTQPDTEEGAALDTTFNESVDSGAQPVVPHDHTYPVITTQTPNGAKDTTQQPASSTSGSQLPAPPRTPSRWSPSLANILDRVNSLCSLPQEIIQHSAVLDMAYNDLMVKFFDKLRITHAERLSDLNTCRTSMSNAVRSGRLRSRLGHRCWGATLGRRHITSPLTQFGCYQTPSDTTSTS